jgi:hypothetical protein
MTPEQIEQAIRENHARQQTARETLNRLSDEGIRLVQQLIALRSAEIDEQAQERSRQ